MKSLILAVSLSLSLGLQAHEGKKHDLTTAMTAAKTAVVAGEASVTTAAKAAGSIDWNALSKQSANSHLHNKFVHFPIALGLLGILYYLLAGRFPSLKPAARWTLFFAALSSVAAIITGRRQEDDIDTALGKQVLELHEAFGYGIAIGLFAAWAMSFVDSARKWWWFFAIVLALAIIGSGQLGGILAHFQL